MAKRYCDINLKKQYAILALKWCKDFFGENDRKRSKLQFEFTERKRTLKGHMVYGNYCFYRNKMTIHEPACDTLFDVVSTVIHEYTHYLQSRPLYKIYQDNYYYSTNPYEREAKRNEQKYTKLCMREIKKLI